MHDIPFPPPQPAALPARLTYSSDPSSVRVRVIGTMTGVMGQGTVPVQQIDRVMHCVYVCKRMSVPPRAHWVDLTYDL
jgi:hypothetical protein